MNTRRNHYCGEKSGREGIRATVCRMRFHAQLLSAASLLKLTPDEAVTKATDLRFAKELAIELNR